METEKRLEDLKRIIDHFGVGGQVRKFNEEAFELTEAILTKGKEEILEEVADCLVLIGQFVEHFELSDEEITEKMDFKIARTILRINRDELGN